MLKANSRASTRLYLLIKVLLLFSINVENLKGVCFGECFILQWKVFLQQVEWLSVSYDRNNPHLAQNRL